MQLKPLRDHLVIEHDKPVERTYSGIILTQESQDQSKDTGTVVAAGPGDPRYQKDGMTVRVGDRVLFSKYVGTVIKLEGKEYVVITERDVIAIFNQEEKNEQQA